MSGYCEVDGGVDRVCCQSWMTQTWNTGKSNRRGGRGAVCGDTNDVRATAAGGVTVVGGVGGADSLGGAGGAVVVAAGRYPTGRTMSMKRSLGSDEEKCEGSGGEGREEGWECVPCCC